MASVKFDKGIAVLLEEIDRLKEILYIRDKFLVEKGLWQEFVGTVQAPSQLKDNG